VLFDGDAVTGVRTGDRGIDKHGEKKSTFEPGVGIRAKVTIFTDGVRGNLSPGLVRPSGSTMGRSGGVCDWPQGLWEVPAARVARGASSTRWATR
jgi:electron-transferring-flavoprotein dehydrogenase